MTETINYVREDHIQDERTAGMFQAVNDNHHRKASAEEQAHMAGQSRIEEIEAEEAAKRDRFWTLIHTAVGAVAILAVIYYLREIGAMHDALAQIFALVTAFGAGKIIGEVWPLSEEA